MERTRVTELHYMTARDNLPSIAQHGLLSHARASRVPHVSVASEDVQRRRAVKQIPPGKPLHEFVNLYFDARNAMMWLRRSPSLAVLRISPQVLGLPGVVVADGNAASSITRFYPVVQGIEALDAERVYAHSWKCDDLWEEAERKRQRQAEVLVPDRVPASYIMGCFAWSETAAHECRRLVADWPTEVNAHVYFG